MPALLHPPDGGRCEAVLIVIVLVADAA